MPKAINISAHEAEEIQYLPNDTVLISINPTDGELFPLKINREDARILTVRFDDVTDDKEYNGTIVKRKIDYETCLKILDFINLNKDKNFVINCAMGVSRSAAICLYLHLQHGHELKRRYWQTSNPNKYVLGSLFFYRYSQK